MLILRPGPSLLDLQMNPQYTLKTLFLSQNLLFFIPSFCQPVLQREERRWAPRALSRPGHSTCSPEWALSWPAPAAAASASAKTWAAGGASRLLHHWLAETLAKWAGEEVQPLLHTYRYFSFRVGRGEQSLEGWELAEVMATKRPALLQREEGLRSPWEEVPPVT